MKKYDYIILGAGPAGLQLTMALLEDTFFKGKSILIIDQLSKTANDRTWCFWESNSGKWDHLVSKSWSLISVGQKKLNEYKLTPSKYKMIQGVDFNSYALSKLRASEQVEIVKETVVDVSVNKGLVKTNLQEYVGEFVFDSIVKDYKLKSYDTWLKQHFVGWKIKTETPSFNPDVAYFMDFRVSQQGNTRFMYVLPSSETEALVEYTLFSEDELSEVEYESNIQDYITNHLEVEQYEVIEKERGVIPMTNFAFDKRGTKNYMPIGTAGGWTKASTGFTFKYIEKKVAIVVEQLKSGALNSTSLVKSKYRFYDSVLLHVLKHNNEIGGEIFERIFENNKTETILRFLDETSTLWEDLKIINSCPKWVFIRSFFQLLKLKITS